MTSDLRSYPDYKDSGLPWLGCIPAHWKLRRAKYLYREVDERSQTGEEELCSVSHKTGVTPRKENVTMFMAESTVGYKICRPNDLAINTLWAWMAALGIARQVGVVSPAYGVYRPLPGSELVPDFADRMLRIEEYKAEYMARSTGVNASRLRLYPDQFLRIPLLLPTRDEQVAIAHYLEGMDRKVRRFIRNRRRLIEVLNEQKQAIINRAVTRGLDPNAPLKTSGIDWLGDIPERWRPKRLRHISPRVGVGLVINPSTYFIDEDSPDGIPMILGNNVEPNGFKLNRVRRISSVSNALLYPSRLNCGDVVVVRVGAPGVAAVVPPSLDQANCASVLIVRGHPTFDSNWLAYCLNSPVLRRQVDVVKYGAAQKQFNVSHAVDFWFSVPPRDEQAKIAAQIDAKTATTNRAIQIIMEEISLIREYRTRLIADVVTGKVDVRGIEVSEVAEEELLALDEDTGESDDVIDDEPELEVAE
jgi:type I restriction enzyme, S subunit